MSYSDFIELQHEKYLNFFVQSISELSIGKKVFATELLIELNDESLFKPYNLFRIDAIGKNEEQDENSIFDIQLDPISDDKKIHWQNNSTSVTINSFNWNDCQITIDELNHDLLERWILKWLKVDSETQEGLETAIHHCTKPGVAQNNSVLTVDLGTAPVEALIELINDLSLNGAKDINLSSTP